MMRVIVPLTAIVAVLVAFLVVRVQAGRARRERLRIEERERDEAWANRMFDS